MIVEISLQTVFLKVTAKHILYRKILLDYQKKKIHTKAFEISLKLLPSIVLKM